MYSLRIRALTTIHLGNLQLVVEVGVELVGLYHLMVEVQQVITQMVQLLIAVHQFN
jgi:hypothetical protein